MMMWNRMKVIWGVSLFITMNACSSAKQAIGESAAVVADHARVSQDLAGEIVETTAEPGTSAMAGEIVDLQDAIIAESEGIRSELHHVEDSTPIWAKVISRVSTAAAILGIGFLAWHLGVGHLTRRMFWAMGWFIPESAMRSAETDMKALNGHEMNYREAVAVRRSSDPAYEAARKKIRRSAR
jgi:hypothetical protein